MVVTSQNGWSINPPLHRYTVTDRGAQISLREGPAGDLLAEFIRRFDQRVEDVDQGADDWGYANRTIAGSSVISNHASGTAVDINATRHEQGRVCTFSAQAVGRLEELLAEFHELIRWGGHYTWPSLVDEMHFEIVGSLSEVTEFVNNTMNPEEEIDVSTVADTVRDIGYRLWDALNLRTKTTGGTKPGEKIPLVEDFNALKWRVEALMTGRPKAFDGPRKGEVNMVASELRTIHDKLDRLTAAVDALRETAGQN